MEGDSNHKVDMTNSNISSSTSSQPSKTHGLYLFCFYNSHIAYSSFFNNECNKFILVCFEGKTQTLQGDMDTCNFLKNIQIDLS